MAAIHKPWVKILPLSERPAKAYAFSLLKAHIADICPRRSLDAGCGELRNRWMFSGEYVGITHNRSAYFMGLKRGENEGLQSEVYAMRLETDFSFLGTFDLVVSTQTLIYVEDPLAVVRRLSDRVGHGGSLIFDYKLEEGSEKFRSVLATDYANVDIVYYGFEDCFDVAPKDRLFELVEREMKAPNLPDNHGWFYLIARNKQKDAVAGGLPPAMIHEGNLHVVEMDLPFLKT